jgi:hypothetical protein
LDSPLRSVLLVLRVLDDSPSVVKLSSDPLTHVVPLGPGIPVPPSTKDPCGNLAPPIEDPGPMDSDSTAGHADTTCNPGKRGIGICGIILSLCAAVFTCYVPAGGTILANTFFLQVLVDRVGVAPGKPSSDTCGDTSGSVLRPLGPSSLVITFLFSRLTLMQYGEPCMDVSVLPLYPSRSSVRSSGRSSGCCLLVSMLLPHVSC